MKPVALQEVPKVRVAFTVDQRGRGDIQASPVDALRLVSALVVDHHVRSKGSEDENTSEGDTGRDDQWGGVFRSPLGEEDVCRDDPTGVGAKVHDGRPEGFRVLLGRVILHERLPKTGWDERSTGNEEGGEISRAMVRGGNRYQDDAADHDEQIGTHDVQRALAIPVRRVDKCPWLLGQRSRILSSTYRARQWRTSTDQR